MDSAHARCTPHLRKTILDHSKCRFAPSCFGHPFLFIFQHIFKAIIAHLFWSFYCEKHHLASIGKPAQNAVIPKAICLHISALPGFQWPPLSSETSSTEIPGDIARYGFGCQNIPRHNFLQYIRKCSFSLCL